MKPAVFCTLAGTAIMMTSTVNAHGQMLLPSYRPITAKYRQDCLFGLKGAGTDELQWAPIENLSQRGQADQPAAKTFDMYNGCRGLVYESGNNVTALTAGTPFDVQYYIQAPHPGVMKLSIVKPSTDSDGKITYKADTQIGSFSDFATSAGTFTVKATIPTSVTGCESAGDCALQFLWHSDIANQTYPTCADITISGSGAGTSTSKTTTVAPSTASSEEDSSSGETSQTTTAPKATTAAPAAAATKTTDDTEAAGEASYTADSTDASATDASADDTTQASGDDSTTLTSTDASSNDSTTPAATEAPTATDAPATDAPEVTSAPETDSAKCSVRRVRRVRQ